MNTPTVKIRRILLLSTALISLVLAGGGCSDNTSTTEIAASVNTAPVIRSVSASPSAVTRGGSSQIQVFADDAENDELEYTYSIEGGTIDADGAQATWTAPATEGKYILTVKISDGRTTTEAWVTLFVFIPLTTINGTLTLNGAASGDLHQTRVYLRAGATARENDQLIRRVPTAGSGRQVEFTIDKVTPGRYYLEAWRDLNGDGLIGDGDYYGYFGDAARPGDNPPPLTIAEGETRFVNLSMSLLAAGNNWDDQGGDDGRPGRPGDNRNKFGDNDAGIAEDTPY